MRTFLAVSVAILLAFSAIVWKLQPPPTEDGRVVITWVSDANPTRAAQAALFEKLHPNIKVNLDPANSGVEKVIVQANGGVGPDLFDAFDGFELAAYVKSGVALDITQQLSSQGIDLASQVFPGVLGSCVLDNRSYGVPANIAADGIWYHADLLRQAGVTLPKPPYRWESFIPIAQKLTKRRPDGTVERYGLLFEWWDWRHFFAGYGAHMFNENGTRCTTDSPYAIAAIQMMADLVYKYHVSPTPTEESSMATEGGFGAGYISLMAGKRGAMAIGGRWWLTELRNAKGLELGVAESPVGQFPASRAYGRSTLVNRHSLHLKEALEFQKFLTSDAYLDLVNDQADGIAAFRRADEKPSFEFNPKYPQEKDNKVWLAITEKGVADDTSPFVDSKTATRLFQVQMDLVQAGQKSPKAAMIDAAAHINAAIAQAITEDPDLAQRYRRALQEVPHDR